MQKRSLILNTLVIYLLFFFLFASQCYGGNIKIPCEMTHEKIVLPGQKIRGFLPIMNTGVNIEKVKVYLVDYLYFLDGTNYFNDPGSSTRSNANWITLQCSYLEIPPMSTVNVSYHVQVPHDPNLKGSYWSMIFVEPQELPEGNPGGQNIGVLQTVIRYGFQIVTHIGQTGEYNLKILNKQLVQREGKKLFQVGLENTGTRRNILKTCLEVFNSFGQMVGHIEGRSMKINPSCSVNCELDLSTIPKGEYQAMLILDYGEKAVFGAQYTLAIP